MRLVHLGRSTCRAISGRGDQSTKIPERLPKVNLPQGPGKAQSQSRSHNGFKASYRPEQSGVESQNPSSIKVAKSQFPSGSREGPKSKPVSKQATVSSSLEWYQSGARILSKKIIKSNPFWQYTLLHSMFFTSHIKEFAWSTSSLERFQKNHLFK